MKPNHPSVHFGADQERASVEVRLGALRACLALIEGRHPFHNFTKRRLYRNGSRESRRHKGNRPKHTGEQRDAVL